MFFQKIFWYHNFMLCFIIFPDTKQCLLVEVRSNLVTPFTINLDISLAAYNPSLLYLLFCSVCAGLAVVPQFFVIVYQVMQKHQKYFSLRNANGKLMPYFIAVRVTLSICRSQYCTVPT